MAVSVYHCYRYTEFSCTAIHRFLNSLPGGLRVQLQIVVYLQSKVDCLDLEGVPQVCYGLVLDREKCPEGDGHQGDGDNQEIGDQELVCQTAE